MKSSKMTTFLPRLLYNYVAQPTVNKADKMLYTRLLCPHSEHQKKSVPI
jgi:hypothetical protein